MSRPASSPQRLEQARREQALLQRERRQADYQRYRTRCAEDWQRHRQRCVEDRQRHRQRCVEDHQLHRERCAEDAQHPRQPRGEESAHHGGAASIGPDHATSSSEPAAGSSRSRRQLYAEAQRAGITGRSTMTKAQLAQALGHTP